MVQDLERSRQTYQLPEFAPAANPVFFRTYSRRDVTADQQRESWEDVCKRTLSGLVKLGNLSEAEADLIGRMQSQLKSMPSGRWLWVGGGLWIERPENFSGAYNCTSTNVVDWRAFGLMMDLAMMGCGTGAMLEPKYIGQLPAIRNHLTVVMQGEIGGVPASERQELTDVTFGENQATIRVGDSRQGWVKSYQTLLELSTDERFSGDLQVIIDLSHVRPAGEKLKGFGGVANPIRLPALYERCTTILNKAIGRQLTSVECCLLIDEAAACVVAGNIRRCLPEDALVHTSKGLVPIKAVQVGDLVQTPLGFRKVVDKFDQGLQDVYDIDTNATAPRATLNHKYAVLVNASGGVAWKQMSQLVPGDRLMHNTQILPGTVTHLPPAPASLTTPDLTPDIAWLIGLTHGKGYVSHEPGLPYGRIEWTVRGRTPQVVGRIREKISTALAQFGTTATHGFVQEDYSARSYCTDLDLVDYFHSHIKQANVPTEVPAFILQGSIDIRAAYLAGLMDSEGSTNRPSQLLSTAYSSFVRQVGSVLSSLGIAGRMKLMQPPALGWQAQYSLSIAALKDRYNALIAPHSARGMLRQTVQPGFTLPNTLMRKAYSYREMQAMGFSDAGVVTADYEQYRAESTVELDIPVTVKGLGSYDHLQTYDIEVEEVHCFYCDGYLTHNSAGMRQGDSTDTAFAEAKENLWQQDAAGNWRIDPERDVLRMANHTRVFHVKPTREECVNAVRKQFYSGEGAIQWAGEAVARANCDLLTTSDLKAEFLTAYSQGQGRDWLQTRYPEMPDAELEHRLGRYGLNPCGEIIGENFHCNLAEIHLNRLDPQNFKEQDEAFTAGALSVASLLNHRFQEPRYRYSRQLDPIVGVSFTGLFDFFVQAFGSDWLRWWEQGRPDTVPGLQFRQREQEYLNRWKETVHRVVWDYCDRHGLKRPNRCTTVQPAGTKSLLTGASPGWHPPKAQRFIRRITFRKNDPVALACLEYGYKIVPSQSDKDENGRLLDDAFDPRCTEWLVEIPVEVSWANLPGADEIEISKFSALAQMDFYMQVQKYFTAHNTSATIELRESEVEALAERIYQAVETNEGYISAALLARFDDHQTFPRLPFEPISKAEYEQLSQDVLMRRRTSDFQSALRRYDSGELFEAGPAGCDSDKCMLPEQK